MMHTLRKIFTLALMALLGGWLVAGVPAAAQSWDNSGNGLLKGTYYFRSVIWDVAYQDGSLDDYFAVYGNITFDGNGNYNITNAQVYEASNNSLRSFSTSGTYSVSASGYGFLNSPFFANTTVYGLVSKGIFVASTTDDGVNDLFIAAQVNTSATSNSAFRGSYSLVGLDLPTGVPSDTRESRYTLNPDGNGGLGTVQATGYIAGRGSSVVSQTLTNVRYSVSNGAAVVFLGGTLSATNLIAGNKYLYLSADGDFVFGGSPNGGDMIVGVRTGGNAPSFNGLYYEAGVYQDESHLATAGYGDLNTYYGSLRALSGGNLLGHQRLLSLFQNNPIDYTYSGGFTLGGDGTYDSSGDHFVFGPNGTVRIGIGTGASLGIRVAVQAPSFTPTSSVFIDPAGVVNAGSSAMFTTGVSAGELVTIYGTNLAPSTQVSTSFPTTLNGVQVLVNGRQAPIYVVSSTQISAVIPFATTETIAAIQVVNNGVSSNTVTEFTNSTTPGAFTKPEGGIGFAAALHADNTLVSSASPAKPGETISVYVTGLGAVTPAVSDGAPGPSDPLSTTANGISVYVGGTNATVAFAGLAPGLVGLYQINFTVPSSVSSGNLSLGIAGPDSYAVQSTLPVGLTGSVLLQPAITAPLPLPARATPGHFSERKARRFSSTFAPSARSQEP